MDLLSLEAGLLAFGSRLATLGEGERSPGNPFAMFLPIIIIFAIFYFLLIAPQRKNEKRRREMIRNIKKNDLVIFSGGILGTVMNVRDRDVVVKVDDSNNTRLKILKSAILEVAEKKGTD